MRVEPMSCIEQEGCDPPHPPRSGGEVKVNDVQCFLFKILIVRQMRVTTVGIFS